MNDLSLKDLLKRSFAWKFWQSHAFPSALDALGGRPQGAEIIFGFNFSYLYIVSELS